MITGPTIAPKWENCEADAIVVRLYFARVMSIQAYRRLV